MLTYLWKNNGDGKYYGLDGSVYDSEPTFEQVAALQQYSRQFVNDEEGYRNAFNQNVASHVEGPLENYYTNDGSCLPLLCGVTAKYVGETTGNTPIVSAATTYNNSCYQIELYFWNLQQKSGDVKIGHHIMYADTAYTEDGRCTPMPDRTDMKPCPSETTKWIGICFYDESQVDINDPLAFDWEDPTIYAWFPIGSSAEFYRVAKTVYAFKRTITVYSGETVVDKPYGGTYDDPEPENDWSLSVSGNTLYPVWMSIGTVEPGDPEDPVKPKVSWTDPVKMSDSRTFQTEWADESADAFYARYLDGYKLLPLDPDYLDPNNIYEGIRETDWENDARRFGYGNWTDHANGAHYMAMANCVSGKWEDWSVVKIVGADGASGMSVQTVMAFANVKKDMSPMTPSGGTYHNGEITGITAEDGVIWTTDNEGRQDDQYTWLSTGKVEMVNGREVYGWTKPMRITGDDGIDGTDSENREYIYRRFVDLNAFDYYKQHYKDDDFPENRGEFSASSLPHCYYMVDSTIYQQNDFIPTPNTASTGNEVISKWLDHPEGITEDIRVEVCSVRIKTGDEWVLKLENAEITADTQGDHISVVTGEKIDTSMDGWVNNYFPGANTADTYVIVLVTSTETRYYSVSYDYAWGDFSEPFIWSSWGEDGLDGDGVEYIYCITPEANCHYERVPETAITAYTTAVTWVVMGSVPDYCDAKYGERYIMVTGATGDNAYYVKTFQFPYQTLIPPSKPELSTPPTTEEHIRYDYYQAPDFVPGNKVDDDVHSACTASTGVLWDIVMKYNPSFSGLSSGDRYVYLKDTVQICGWDRNWTDNPLDVGPSQPYEWVCVRKYKKGTEDTTKEWGEYSEPSLWNNWASEGTSVYTSFVFCRTYDDISGMKLCGGVFEYPMPGIVYDERPDEYIYSCRTENSFIEFKEESSDTGITYKSEVTYNDKKYVFEDTVPRPTGDLNETIWMSMRIIGDDETGENQGWTSPQMMADSTDFNVEFCSADLTTSDIDFLTSSAANFSIFVEQYPDDDYKHTNAETAWRTLVASATTSSSSDWSDDGVDAIYMATTTFRNGKWTNWSVSKIKGEKGDAGAAMKISGSTKGVVIGHDELQYLTGLTVGDYYAVICSDKGGQHFEICRFNGVGFVSLGYDEYIEDQTGFIINGITEEAGGNQFHTAAEIAAGCAQCNNCPGLSNNDLLVWGNDGDTGWIKMANLGGDSSYIHIKYADWLLKDPETNEVWYRLTRPRGSYTTDGEFPGKYMGMYADNTVADNTGVTGTELTPNVSGDYHWCKNGDPYMWTFWGGEDGFGYEYIYQLTQDNTPPPVPTAYTVDSVEYQANDFVPDGWTDDAIQCTSVNRYRWKCFRQKENGRWKAFEGNNGYAIFDANCANDLLVADFNNDFLPVYVKEKRVLVETEYTVTASLSEGDTHYVITSLTPPSVSGVEITGISGTGTTAVTCHVKITTGVTFAANENSILLDFVITGHEEGTTLNKSAHCSLTILPVGTGVIYHLVPGASEIKWDDENNRAREQYFDCNILKSVLGESSEDIDNSQFHQYQNDFKVTYSLYNNDTPVTGKQNIPFPGGSGVNLWDSSVTNVTYNNIVIEVYGRDSQGQLTVLNDKETIHALRDGQNGTSPYLADLYNDFDSIPLDDQGNVTPLDISSTAITIPSRISLFEGATEIVVDSIAYRINGQTGYTEMNSTDTWYNVPSSGTDDICVKQIVDGSGRRITVKVKNGITWRNVTGVDASTNQLKLDILVKKFGGEYCVATMTMLGIMPGAEGEPVTIMNLFPSTTSIVKKTENGVWTREPSAVTCNLIERQGTGSTTYESGTNDFNNIITPVSSGGRGYSIRYYFESHSGSTSAYTTTVGTTGVSTSTLDEFLTFLLYNKDGVMVDKESIPVVSDGEPGGPGPQGRGVVATCEYYVYTDTPDGSKLTPNPSQNTGFIINDYGTTTSCRINNKTCPVTMIGTYLIDSNTVTASTTTTIPASTSDAPYLWKRTVNWYNSEPIVEQGPVEFVTSKQIVSSTTYYSKAVTTANTPTLQTIWQNAKNSELTASTAISILTTGLVCFDQTSAEDPDPGETVWCVTVIFYTDNSCFVGPMSVCKTTVNVEDIEGLLRCFGEANVTFDRGAYLKEFLGVIDISADPENLKKADVKAFLNATNYWSSSTNNRLMFAAGVTNLGFNGGQTIPSGQTPNMNYFSATTKIWENGLLECKNASIEGAITANTGTFGNSSGSFTITNGGLIGTANNTEFFKLDSSGVRVGTSNGARFIINSNALNAYASGATSPYLTINNSGLEITGEVHANSGNIGCLNVDSNGNISHSGNTASVKIFEITNDGKFTCNSYYSASTGTTNYVISSEGYEISTRSGTSTDYVDNVVKINSEGYKYLYKSFSGSYGGLGEMIETNLDKTGFKQITEDYTQDSSAVLTLAGWNMTITANTFSDGIYNSMYGSSGFESHQYTASHGTLYRDMHCNFEGIEIDERYVGYGTEKHVKIYPSGMTIDGPVSSTTGFYQTSDARLKNLGEPLKDVLSKIDKIDTVYYTLKDDEEHKRRIGTTAQSLLKDFPEFVSGSEEDKYDVNYAELSVLALAAIKELKKEVQDLKDEIKKLKKQ